MPAECRRHKRLLPFERRRSSGENCGTAPRCNSCRLDRGICAGRASRCRTYCRVRPGSSRRTFAAATREFLGPPTANCRTSASVNSAGSLPSASIHCTHVQFSIQFERLQCHSLGGRVALTLFLCVAVRAVSRSTRQSTCRSICKPKPVTMAGADRCSNRVSIDTLLVASNDSRFNAQLFPMARCYASQSPSHGQRSLLDKSSKLKGNHRNQRISRCVDTGTFCLKLQLCPCPKNDSPSRFITERSQSNAPPPPPDIAAAS